MNYTRLNLKNGDIFNETHIKHFEDTFENVCKNLGSSSSGSGYLVGMI